MYAGSGPYGAATVIQAPFTGSTVSYSPIFTEGLIGPPAPDAEAACAGDWRRRRTSGSAALRSVPWPDGRRSPGGGREEPVATAIVPIRIPKDGGEDLEDPRLSDVDEWGRSEHTRAMARALYEPVYSKWFRAEWEGLEKIPDRGRRAAGRQPRRGHPLGRPGDHARHREGARTARSTAWPTTSSATLPVVGTLWARAGGVPAHPDNAYRLLQRPGPAGARLPRGHQGAVQDLSPTATSSGASGAAASSRSPCGPACRSSPSPWSGSEEAMPIVFRLPALARLLGVPVLPRHRQHARLRAARPASCPSRPSSSCASSTPSPSTSRRTRSATRRAGSWRRPSTIRIHHPGDPLRHAARPPQRLVRLRRRWVDASSSPGPTPSGAAAWSRPWRRDPEHGDDPRAWGPAAPSVPLRAGRVRPGRPDLLDPDPDRAGHPGGHHRPHLPGRRLDPVPRRALHEINVIGTMNLLAAAGAAGSPVRQVVVKSSTLVYGSSATDPEQVPRGDAPHVSPATHAGRALAGRGRGARARLRRGQPGHRGHRAALRQRARHRHRHAASAATCRARSALPSSATTRSCSSSRRTTSSAASSTSPASGSPASTTWPATGGCPGARWPSICGTRLLPLSPVSPLRRPRRWCACFDFPPELEDLLRYGRGVDTSRLRRDRASRATRPAPGRCDASSAPCGCAGTSGTAAAVVHLRAGRRAVLPPLAVGASAPARPEPLSSRATPATSPCLADRPTPRR